MPRGSSDIVDLKLINLETLITSFMSPPNLWMTNFFSSRTLPSTSIVWEHMQGSRGLTPFVAPGSPAPRTAPPGIGKSQAEAAYWKEKIFYDEEFLNNLRRPGTWDTYQPAREKIATDLQMLRNRQDRRKEWMMWKMVIDGSFSYYEKSGYKITVDYGKNDALSETLSAAKKWSTGTAVDIVGDIMDGKTAIADANGGTVDYAFCNSKVLRYMAQDPVVQTVLSKFAFGSGDLFNQDQMGSLIGVNSAAIARLLNLPNLVVFDEQYQVKAYITTAVTADTTTVIYVDEAHDFEVGGTLRFHDVSAGTYEDETISAVDEQAGTVTVSTAPSTSYKAGEDVVTMTRKYIPDDKFIMMASTVDGRKIGEFIDAPHGLLRRWGMKVDRWDENDPEGTWVMVSNKGIPILYHTDSIYTLDVA